MSTSNRKLAIETLEKNGEVVIRCNGNSMRPHIAPNEAIHLKKVDPSKIRVGDAVFCRIGGALQVHLVSAINGDRYSISNAKGWKNDDISAKNIFGLCVMVEDRVRVSDKELAER